MNTAEKWSCTSEEYHADNSLSQSRLKDFIAEPELYFERYVEKSIPGKDSPSFEFGGDFERLLFFEELPAVLVPNEVMSKRTSKEGKVSYARTGAQYKAWEEQAKQEHGEDVKLVREDEWGKQVLPLLLARDRLNEHERARKLIFSGTPHVAFRWEDEQTGLPCKCQLDVLYGGDEPEMIVDLKTAQDASPGGFNRAIGNFGYHIQAEWYTRAVQRWCGRRLPFLFVVVKNSPPYNVETFVLDGEWEEKASRTIDEGLDLFADAHADLEAGNIDRFRSATHNTVVQLSPPKWGTKFDLGL